MISLKLDKENQSIRELNPVIDVLEIKDDEVIQNCIDLFNSEIDWEGMFTLSDAKNRIANDEKMYVGYRNGRIFGHFWLKKINDNSYYIYNVFSKNTSYKREYGATDMIYHVISNLDFISILAHVDDWNTKSLNVFEKLGFQHM